MALSSECRTPPHVRHVCIEAKGRVPEGGVSPGGPLTIRRVLQLWIIHPPQALSMQATSRALPDLLSQGLQLPWPV